MRFKNYLLFLTTCMFLIMIFSGITFAQDATPLNETEGASADVAITSVNAFDSEVNQGNNVSEISENANNMNYENSVLGNSLIPTKVNVNNSTLDLFVGGNFTIVATTEPEGLNVTYVPDNSGVVSVDDDGVVTALKKGNATITVKVGDNVDYAENSTEVIVNVLPTVIGSDITLSYNETVLYNATFFDSKGKYLSKGTVVSFEIINGNITNETISNDEGLASLSVKLPAGEYTVIATNPVTGEYSKNIITVTKVDLNLTTYSMSLGQNTTIIVSGFGNATGNITVNIGKDNYTSPIMMGLAFVSIPQISENVTAYIYYPGDNNYNNASTSVDIVFKKSLNITASADPILVGENATIIITGFENATGNASVIAGRGFYNATIIDGTSTLIISGLNSSSRAFIIYRGDNNYNMAYTTVNITVLQNASVSVNNSTLDLDVNDTFTIVAVTTPEGLNVTYVPDNSGVVSVDDNGLVTAIKEGTAIITVKVGGDGVYAENSTNVTVTVRNRENPTINVSADEVIAGQNTTISVELPEDATGNVTATVNGETFVSPVVDGKANITIPDLDAGNYTVPVSYSGDEKYKNVTKDVNLTVDENYSVYISAPDVTKYYHGSERFVVNVTDYKGNPLTNRSVAIVINGVSYNRTTDDQGEASIAINLGPGVYNITSIVGNESVSSVVTVLTTVNGSDITKVFKNGTQYYATFKDTNGNYLADGTEVEFNINGVMYKRYINGSEGKAKLNINLNPGEYVITATNPNSTEMSSNIIKVISQVSESNDLVKYFKNDSQYRVKIVDIEGNAVGANETVKFNINGVMYERQTDEEGYAQLNINLNPGNYVITAEYNGSMVSNNIEVLPVLTAYDLTMKAGTSDQFKARLVDGQGKLYPNQRIDFNINGQLFNSITDAEGTASLTINLGVGQYTITSSYGNASIANIITVY